MFTLKRLATLAVSVFCLAAVHGTAGAAIIHVDENLNDNMVPAGFSLTTTNTAGLANGRLEATAINGSTAIVYETMPGNLSQIDISYRGHFGYSLWGTYTVVSLGGLPVTMTHGANEFTHGLNNFASITGDTTTGPFNFSEFEYAITVVDGQVSYTGVDTATNTQAFSLTYTDVGVVLADIDQISFRAHNTTGTEPVWLDDINIQLHTVAVPAPATLALFGLGIAGLGLARRRRAVG